MPWAVTAAPYSLPRPCGEDKVGARQAAKYASEFGCRLRGAGDRGRTLIYSCQAADDHSCDDENRHESVAAAVVVAQGHQPDTSNFRSADD
jgi:hypothetical protein